MRCRSWWFILGNHGREEKHTSSSLTGFRGSVAGLQIPSMAYPQFSTFRIILKQTSFIRFVSKFSRNQWRCG